MTTASHPSSVERDLRGLVLGAASIGAVTATFRLWLPFDQPTVQAFTYLVVVLAVAATCRLWVAMAVSVLANLCLNFFFMHPVGTFTIADPENWAALFVFLAVSLVAGAISVRVRARAQAAIARRDELEQLLEARRTAEVATRRDAFKTTLLASLGHDLRTPLTAIRVAAENLRAAEVGHEERSRQIHLILGEVTRLSQLFENILEMTRLDAGVVAPDLQWVDPLEVVEAARDQVAPSLAGHAVDVDVRGHRLVRVDPRLTASALARVLENAAAYGRPDATIDVHVPASADALVLTVRDHGRGIGEEELPHLFERSYRGAAAAGSARPGAGMGLAIARGLLAAERGSIRAANHPDGGAVFTIEVPAAVRAAPEEELA